MASFIAWLVAFEMISILIVLSNLATILTFVINRHLRRRGVYCLINLALADMIFGICVMVWSIGYFSFGFLKISKEFYYISYVTEETFFVLSVFSLAVVSLERVYATFFPFQYRTTRFKSYIVVFTMIWSLGFLFSIFPLLYLEIKSQYDNITIVFSMFLLLTLAVIVVSYIAVFVKVKLQNQQHQQHQQQAATQRTQHRERHMAVTLFIVTILSLLTLLPFLIVGYILTIDAIKQSIPDNVEQFTSLLQITNSLINPVVYVFRMRDFRKALFRLVCKCSRDRQQSIHPIGNHGDPVMVAQPVMQLSVM